jgi:hypothetical protein
MTLRIRPSSGGKRLTVYVEHGIFYDASCQEVMVTVPKGSGTVIWSYKPKDPEYQVYKEILKSQDRWPYGAPE